MSTGLAVFDTTIQETNQWLNDVADRLGGDRHAAYSGVRAALHALRDRLPAEMVLALSAQLPMLLRGVFLEGWRIAGTPTNERTIDAFALRVEAELPPDYPLGGQPVASAVFEVMAGRLGDGLNEKIRAHLPEALRQLWPERDLTGSPTAWE